MDLGFDAQLKRKRKNQRLDVMVIELDAVIVYLHVMLVRIFEIVIVSISDLWLQSFSVFVLWNYLYVIIPPWQFLLWSVEYSLPACNGPGHDPEAKKPHLKCCSEWHPITTCVSTLYLCVRAAYTPVHSCCSSDSSCSMCTLPSGVYAFVILNMSVDLYYTSCIHRCFQISPCWNLKDLRLPGEKKNHPYSLCCKCAQWWTFFRAWQSTEKKISTPLILYYFAINSCFNPLQFSNTHLGNKKGHRVFLTSATLCYPWSFSFTNWIDVKPWLGDIFIQFDLQKPLPQKPVSRDKRSWHKHFSVLYVFFL